MDAFREIMKLKRLLYELPPTTEERKFGFLKKKDSDHLITVPGVVDSKSRRTNDKRQKQINEQLKELALLMLHDDDFIKDVIMLAKKWQLTNRQFLADPSELFESRMPGCISLWYDMLLFLTTQANDFTKTLLDVWNDDITTLLKHGLEGYWRQSLEMLLLSGEWILPLHKTVLEVRLFDGSGNYEPQIKILTFADTTIKDIEQRWPEIQEWKSALLNSAKRNKPRKDIQKVVEFNPLQYLDEKPKELSSIIVKQQRVKKDLESAKNRQLRTMPKQIKGQIEVLHEPLTSILIY